MQNIHSNCTNCGNKGIKKSMWKIHRVLIFLRKGFYADTSCAGNANSRIRMEGVEDSSSARL